MLASQQHLTCDTFQTISQTDCGDRIPAGRCELLGRVLKIQITSSKFSAYIDSFLTSVLQCCQVTGKVSPVLHVFLAPSVLGVTQMREQGKMFQPFQVSTHNFVPDSAKDIIFHMLGTLQPLAAYSPANNYYAPRKYKIMSIQFIWCCMVWNII